MREHFERVAQVLCGLLRGDEVFTASLAAEESDFVRFNRSAVRQAGHVVQRQLSVDWIAGRRHAAGQLTLTGELEADRALLTALVDDLRERREALPEDPYLLYARDVRSSEHPATNELADPGACIAAIQRVGRGRDLVGVYAAGTLERGFANSLGQRNWHASRSFHLDWSLHGEGDRAVKSAYAGFEWSPDELERRGESAVRQLSTLGRPTREIGPGRYRVYLAPDALREIVGMLSWGGFGLRAHRTKATPLLRMIEQGEKLHASVSLRENTAAGLAPAFESAGFIRPPEVPLIRSGGYAECLVSPRSSVEFGEPTNGASSEESPLSVEMDPGTLPRDAALRELGTGLWVGNLWYLNYSDRAACRTTGMTRFATFWVENGALAAPVAPLRFDETVYRMLGENLVALTAERDWILDEGTYECRSTRSARLPGALIDDFTFTL